MNKNPVLKPALALDEVSIHHTLDFRPIDARTFAAKCDYHGVDPAKLRQLIREVDGLIPRQNWGKINGKENPNNGTPHHWYTLGKEHSRVLYVNIAKAYLERVNFDYDKLTRQLDALGDKYGADEHWTEENDASGYTYRFWWD